MYNNNEKKMVHEWGPMKMELIETLTSLSCLPASLIETVIAYIDLIEWDPKAYQSWPFLSNGKPRGITSDHVHLYICDSENNILLMYTLNGEIIEQSTPWPSRSPLLVLSPSSSSSSSPSFSLHSPLTSMIPFNQPCAIDYSPIYSQLYIIDENQIHILNLKKEILSQWKLPHGPGHGIKVDYDLIYITLENIHQIFVYSKLGCLLKKFGKEEKGNCNGQFYRPFGISVDDTDIYVCDYNNHRIQVLNKHSGIYSHQWGKQGNVEEHFSWPFCIYFNENIIYVGDSHGVQLFTCHGVFLQKIGTSFWGDDLHSFKCAWGMICVNNTLYVCDWLNHRIQVFKKKTAVPIDVEIVL